LKRLPFLILIRPKTEAYIQNYKGTNFFIDTAHFLTSKKQPLKYGNLSKVFNYF